MNTAIKVGLLATALGLVMHVPGANAEVTRHIIRGNAVNYCQAFTPGPTNTIRNRVVGAENIGPLMNVACNFHSMDNGDASNEPPKQLFVNFFNTNAEGTIEVTCTLLTGRRGGSGPSSYAVPKTVSIPASTFISRPLSWGPSDNPVDGATTLGNTLIGINCALPTGALIGDTFLNWDQDNGIGS